MGNFLIALIKTLKDKIMKIIILSVFTLWLSACQPNEFDSWLIPQGTENMAAIELYPNSPVLIADGKAQLTFKVRAYTEITAHTPVICNEDGHTFVRDSVFLDTVALHPDRIAKEQITITASNGEKADGLTFTTTAAAGEMSFTCQIGNLTSKPCKVRLVKPEIPAFTPRTIPVIFHLLYSPDTKDIAEGIRTEYVTEVLDRLNRVFAGTFAPAPSSLDTKITFVPAETDDGGMALDEKGIHRFDLEAEKLTSFYNTYNYIASHLVWNPEKFLNIWLFDTGGRGASAELPGYILNNGTAIQGLEKATVLADASEAAVQYPEQAGIIAPITRAFSMKNGSSQHRFEHLFGQFFGLYETQADNGYDTADTDYCSDTYVPLSIPVTITKPTAIPDGSNEKPVYFDSFNIMDAYSSSTAITYEQALRIRQVIENCPLRMMKQ